MTEQEWRKEFARRLLKIKHNNKGYDQKELAEASGISESTISHYMKGTRTPKAENLVRLAKALDCTVDELIMVDEIIE